MADPKRGNVRNPQRLNRYAYVSNNPSNGVDPRGLDRAAPQEPMPAFLCEWQPWACSSLMAETANIMFGDMGGAGGAWGGVWDSGASEEGGGDGKKPKPDPKICQQRYDSCIRDIPKNTPNLIKDCAKNADDDLRFCIEVICEGGEIPAEGHKPVQLSDWRCWDHCNDVYKEQMDSCWMAPKVQVGERAKCEAERQRCLLGQ